MMAKSDIQPRVVFVLLGLLNVLDGMLVSLPTVTQTSSSMQNSFWNRDAFPQLPPLRPHSNITIAEFTGPGVVTNLHYMQAYDGGSDRYYMNKNIMIQITYDGDPKPAVFVPVGDFFLDTFDGTSHFEGSLFANRALFSCFCEIPMPFRKSIKIEIINPTAYGGTGYGYVMVENLSSWSPNLGYFHAQYHLTPTIIPFQKAWILEQVLGSGHYIGFHMSFDSNLTNIFDPSFGGICDGNDEFFVDNDTVIIGNSSNPALISYLGTEDFIGFSWCWTEINLNERAGCTWRYHDNTKKIFQLSTYKYMDDNPIRFKKNLSAWINWDYDHNNMPQSCVQTGCLINFAITSFYYLQH